MASDGAIFLTNPDLTDPSKFSSAIMREFFDAAGNSVPNPDPYKIWGGYAEFKNGASFEQPIQQITNRYETNINADLTGINAKLDNLAAALKQQTTAKIESAQNQVQQIIQVGEHRISTNAVPILGRLEAVTSGAADFGALSDATIVALSTSIPWALDFIQSERLGQGNKLLAEVANATLGAPGQIVSGVGAALGDLGRGLLDGISAILSKIEATLIDPIASLLTAILAAIVSLPKRGADALWDSLLLDQSAAATP